MREQVRRGQRYVQGSAVRKLNTLPREQEPLRELSERTLKNRARNLRMSLGYVLFLAVMMVAAGFILTMYITLQSDITNSIKSISSKEKTLNDLKLDNDENYSRIESSVDLEKIRKIAIQELGMRYAEEGQIVYFDGEGSDYVRQTGEIPE